jgi:hypothetical protein
MSIDQVVLVERHHLKSNLTLMYPSLHHSELNVYGVIDPLTLLTPLAAIVVPIPCNFYCRLPPVCLILRDRTVDRLSPFKARLVVAIW